MGLKKLKQNTLIVMAIIIVSKLIGMFRDVVLANYYGTSNISDAYLIAVSVPTFLFYFIGHALSTAFQPIYNKIRYQKSEKEALNYLNNLMWISCLLCTILVGLLLIFPKVIVKIFATGFDVETTLIAVRFVRLCACSLYFMAIVNILGGYLQAHSNFVIPASISLPRNFVIITSIVCSVYWGLDVLGWGVLFAYVFEFLFLLPFAIKSGYRPKLLLSFKDKEIKETLYMVLPIIVGVAVGQINHIVDRSLASTIIVGGISSLTYANVINNAIQEVLVTGIITILFADCAKLVAQEKYFEVKEKLSKTINTMVILLIPASCGVILLAEPIVGCFFMRGNFDESSKLLTAGTLQCYTLGLVFLAVRDTLVKVFYAYKSTKLTTIVSTISILINIVLNFILSYFIGLRGLALATSISAIVNCVILHIALRKKIGDFGTKNMLFTIFKSLLATTLMGLLVYYLYYILLPQSINELFKLCISVLSGVIVYFGVILLFKILSLKRKTKGEE